MSSKRDNKYRDKQTKNQKLERINKKIKKKGGAGGKERERP